MQIICSYIFMVFFLWKKKHIVIYLRIAFHIQHIILSSSTYDSLKQHNFIILSVLKVKRIILYKFSFFYKYFITFSNITSKIILAELQLIKLKCRHLIQLHPLFKPQLLYAHQNPAQQPHHHLPKQQVFHQYLLKL